MNVLIIGAGDVGTHLARRLSREHQVTLVDSDDEVVKRASAQLDALVVEGDASDFDILRKAGIADADVVAALTHNDELNLIICQIARAASPEADTIARVRKEEYLQPDFILSRERLGVDFFVHPEMETAQEIARLLRNPVSTNSVELADGRLQITGMRLDRNSPWCNRQIKDLAAAHPDLPFRIVGVKRKEADIIPRGDTALRQGDHFFVICEEGAVEAVAKISGQPKGDIRNVMILGGGLISQYLARELDRKMHVKIIESNQETTEKVAELLPDTLVIHGDGTDIDLLAQEGIMDMDAYVALTGSDEVNIISTLVARHLQVHRTMALVNNLDYMPITPTIGLDAVVSKELIAVNAVLRFIQGKLPSASTAVPGFDLEVIESEAPPDSRVTERPIKDLKFPEEALIAAVLREGKVIMPTGGLRIQAGDRVVVFAQPEARKDVLKFFR
jgi:trk system potassium uptake protein TrkA